MTAWETLKIGMSQGTIPGSCGYQVEVSKAAILFVSLREHLKNWAVEEVAFNTDKEVTEALINRESFKEIGLIK